MVDVPTVTPVNIPLDEPMIATEVLLLLQVPGPAPSLWVVDPPTHTPGVPVIGDIGFTVTVADVKHPPGIVYDISVVPAARPVTIPDELPIVATPVLPLTHTPPPEALLSVVVFPWHTFIVPVIGLRKLITTDVVATHPAGVV